MAKETNDTFGGEELTAIVMETESLYLQRHHDHFITMVQELFGCTDEQLEHLEATLLEELEDGTS